MIFRRVVIFSTALFVTGCATTPYVPAHYTEDGRYVHATGGNSLAGDLAAGFLGVIVVGDPNRHVSTVTVGGQRHTVTTQVSSDGRRSYVRVD